MEQFKGKRLKKTEQLLRARKPTACNVQEAKTVATMHRNRQCSLVVSVLPSIKAEISRLQNDFDHTVERHVIYTPPSNPCQQSSLMRVNRTT